MILHFIDDHIAADSFLSGFESFFPNRNLVLKLCRDQISVELIVNGKSRFYPTLKEGLLDLDFSQIKIVDIQLLNLTKIKAVSKYFPPEIPVVWWAYGGDLYNQFLFNRGYKLYSEQTYNFIRTHKLKGLLLNLKRVLYKNIYLQYLEKKVLNRIVGFIPCLYPDYELACKWLKKDFDLIDITPWPDILDYPFSEGKDIMVGHSASMTNNHLYALEIIKKIELNDSKICLPLSYNIQSSSYRDVVIKRYNEVFGDKVAFMLELLNVDAYMRKFLQYKVAIFPCWRQEALSNIFACFQLGVRVVMSLHNPCFSYLVNSGYYISALEELNDFKPLSREKQMHNRSLHVRLTYERKIIVKKNLINYFSKFV